MKLSLKIFLVLVFIFFQKSGMVFSEPLEIGLFNFPPYYLVDSKEEVKGGIFVEMLKKMMDRAGYEYTFVAYPPKRLYSNLGKGITHIWLGTLGVAEYEGKTVVSPVKIADINLQVYTNDKYTVLPKSMDDLKGKSVITIFGYNYGGLIKFLEDPENRISIEAAKSHNAAFMMLKLGRANFLLDYHEPSSEVIKEINIPDLRYAPIKKLSMHLHVSKARPDAEEIMQRLMKVYSEMKRENSRYLQAPL